MAASAVLAHEKEHVTNNASKAKQERMKAHSVVAIHAAMGQHRGRC